MRSPSLLPPYICLPTHTHTHTWKIASQSWQLHKCLWPRLSDSISQAGLVPTSVGASSLKCQFSVALTSCNSYSGQVGIFCLFFTGKKSIFLWKVIYLSQTLFIKREGMFCLTGSFTWKMGVMTDFMRCMYFKQIIESKKAV